MEAVAIVGLGAMGSRFAHRLLDGGVGVAVWNRTPDRVKPLVAAGARAAATPADAAAEAKVVLTMVADADALRAVTEGPEGVAAGVSPGAVVVEMSTVGTAAVLRLASVLPEGVGLLDAPVMGSIAEAESGALTIFIGGPVDLFHRCGPLLAALGQPIHVGPLGSGAAAKLVANNALLGVLGVLGETLALAEGLGLPRDVSFRVLAASPLAAQARRRRRQLLTGDYPPRFALVLARKDSDLITEAAEAAGLDLRIVAAVRSWLSDAQAAGRGGQDYSAVLAHILSAAAERGAPPSAS